MFAFDFEIIFLGQLVRVTDKEFLAGPEMNNIQVKTGILRNRPKDDKEIFLYFFN